MFTDFYIRRDTENVNQNILEIDDELSALIIGIEMCFFTKKNDLIGNKNFGLDLEDLMFTYNLNESIIKERIINTIYKYCTISSKFKIDVKVNFIKTDVRDICYIDIIINNVKTFGVII